MKLFFFKIKKIYNTFDLSLLDECYISPNCCLFPLRFWLDWPSNIHLPVVVFFSDWAWMLNFFIIEVLSPCNFTHLLFWFFNLFKKYLWTLLYLCAKSRTILWHIVMKQILTMSPFPFLVPLSLVLDSGFLIITTKACATKEK